MGIRRENTPVLETQRLLLRPFTLGDVEDVFAIYSDREVNRFLPWFPLESRQEAETFLRETVLPEYQKEGAYRYAIVWRATGQVVGYMTLGEIDWEKGSGDLGYGLRRDHWGQGIIPEAGRAVLEQLRTAGFCRITATHDVNNPASGRVMEKLGMTYRCSYLEQWQPKDFPVTFRLYEIEL